MTAHRVFGSRRVGRDDLRHDSIMSHTKEGSAYGVSRDIFVVGQIRMAGRYRGGIFQPQGYENKDISAEPPFKDLCNTAFPVCQRQCWAGGDTEKWFGDP